MGLIESLSRTFARIPGWVFTVFGAVALAVLLGGMARRQWGRMRQAGRVSGKLRAAQDLYEAGARHLGHGERSEALDCFRRSLALRDEIGDDPQERAMIEAAIRKLEEQDDAAHEQEP